MGLWPCFLDNIRLYLFLACQKSLILWIILDYIYFWMPKNITGKAIFTMGNHAKNKYNLILSIKTRLFHMPKINIISYYLENQTFGHAKNKYNLMATRNQTKCPVLQKY